MGLVVDLDVLLADFCLGEALLAERAGERDPAGDDVLGDDRVAAADPEGRAQLGLVLLAGRLEPGKLDRGEAILLARIGGENDAQHAIGALGARLDHRVIITLAAQELREQVGVGAGAAPDLRRVGGILAVRLQRRLLAEFGQQILGIAHGTEALDADRIAKLARRFVLR